MMTRFQSGKTFKIGALNARSTVAVWDDNSVYMDDVSADEIVHASYGRQTLAGATVSSDAGPPTVVFLDFTNVNFGVLNAAVGTIEALVFIEAGVDDASSRTVVYDLEPFDAAHGGNDTWRTADGVKAVQIPIGALGIFQLYDEEEL
jgi:hypothetical protein